jgi:hypothetical protein
MLLNLSNHPSFTWPADQISVAQAAYGEVLDLAFPAIDPLWTSEEVQKLATQYAQEILALEPRPQAVHLMGEMTFSFCLLGILQAQGLFCIASTTQRKVIEKAPGHKEVQFEFVQFRNYPFIATKTL